MKLSWSLAENCCAARQESDFTATFAVLMRETSQEWKLLHTLNPPVICNICNPLLLLVNLFIKKSLISLYATSKYVCYAFYLKGCFLPWQQICSDCNSMSELY